MFVLNGDANDTNAIDHVPHKAFRSLASYSPAEVQYKLHNYYKFMFVREPLRRVVSAYKDKLCGNNEYYEKAAVQPIIQKFRNKYKKAPPKGVTLEEFFLSLKATLPGAMDEHWIPMYQVCQPCAISYDFIGTMENMDNDSEEVLIDMQVKDKVKLPRKQKMYNTRKGPKTEELLNEVPRYLLKQILSKYQKDYELFSYDTPEL
jgi:dermatan 4-sulfotransferase 1